MDQDINSEKKKRILIIDDEDILTEVIKRLLEKEGYWVYIINDPRLVRDQFIENFFDMIILDMKMPHLTGAEVLIIIKEKQASQKVIMCSGWFDGDPLFGCVATLSKPFKAEELLKILRENLDDK